LFLGVEKAMSKLEKNPGFTIWFTGLPGSGKTTLVEKVASEFCRQGHSKVEVLDETFFPEAEKFPWHLESEAYDAFLLKLGVMANLLSQDGGIVLVSSVSPRREIRRQIRRNHESPFVLVYVDASLSALMKRDGRKFYSRSLQGGVQKLLGRIASYEKPNPPDIQVTTDGEKVEKSVQTILRNLTQFELTI
jgi:adenylylsulfate kinase